MEVRAAAQRFVDLCRQGKNVEVMQTMYAPDVVSVEADGSETAGQEAVLNKSLNWVADKSFDAQEVGGPFFNGTNQFAVHFIQKVTPKSTGKQITLEEVAVYTVNPDGLISREHFFFDGSRG
jgi:ketosteroid isomerase-like protein